eukprot:TRINITY_DN3701_c0_g1_i1.p2 TRINITY_DN3701_c0_g1~~TRINITY_DN3701_c0_g1_i1.p2  ORF type:complete len:132 (-),score=4.53 TRINITY_DN3701_c0_g1_i1:43-438(-)
MISSAFLLTNVSVLPIAMEFSVSYGAMWVINATLPVKGSVTDPRYWQTLAAIVLPLGGIGSIVINAIVGYLYQRAATNGLECYGPECFRISFFMLAALSVVMFFLCLIPIVYHRRRNQENTLKVNTSLTNS